MNTTKEIVPEVGMGATTGFNGDAYPHTIVKVISPKKILVTSDSYKVLEKNACFKEGPIECEFKTDWNGTPTTVTKRKNGRWIAQGEPMNSGWSYRLGKRVYAQNPHF
jgi:hypothetical protein